MHLKKYVFLRWGVIAQDQALVCCGHVLEDNMLLADLSKKVQDSEIIWFTLCKLPRAENEMFPIQALKSMFSLSTDCESSKLQNAGQCICIFLKFCQRFSGSIISVEAPAFKKRRLDDSQQPVQSQDSEFTLRTQFTWMPTESEQRSLRSNSTFIYKIPHSHNSNILHRDTGCALQNAIGAAQPFPQVIWKESYGCAILSTSTSVNTVHLQVLVAK